MDNLILVRFELWGSVSAPVPANELAREKFVELKHNFHFSPRSLHQLQAEGYEVRDIDGGSLAPYWLNPPRAAANGGA